MTYQYPYVSDEQKHLLKPEFSQVNHNSIANITYQKPQKYYGMHNIQAQYQPVSHKTHQNNYHYLPQQQKIVFLPSPHQQHLNDSKNQRFDHDSFAADDLNQRYTFFDFNNQKQHENQITATVPQQQKQIVHKIQYGDTLQGLSLLYDISISKIKQRNQIDGDSIYYLKQLVIPNPQASPLQTAKTQQIMIEQFLSHMPFEQKSDKVALFYLKDYNWNMDLAIKAFKDDLEWERKNKIQIKSKPIQNNNKNNRPHNYTMLELSLKKAM